MTGDVESAGAVPPALEALLKGYDARQASWDELPVNDRNQYADWVTRARTERTAHRRALMVLDRAERGQGWVGPLRRWLGKHYIVPRGTSPEDAWSADQRGDFPFGSASDGGG